MKKSEMLFGLAKIPLDAGMAFLAFMAAYRLRHYTDLIPGIHFQPIDTLSFPSLPDFLTLAGWTILALVLVLALNKMYSLRKTNRLGSEIFKLIFLVSAWIMLIIGYYFITRQFFFSRLVLGYIWILTIVALSLGRIGIRILQHTFARFGIGRRRILMIGDNILTQKISKKLKQNPIHHIVGLLTLKGTTSAKTTLRVLGSFKNLEEIVKKYHIEEIIQTASDLSETEAEGIIKFCRENHLQYHFVPDILQMHSTQIDVFNIDGLPMISLKATPLDGWGRVFKRIFDSMAAGFFLILLSPPLLLVALGIKLDSRGPILFTRKDNGDPVQRVGYQGQLIPFYKFRTMKHKTDSLRYTDLAEKNIRKNSPLLKIKNDPRVTRFGRFLRRWSLDELPQLWSVLIGDLSLVGPRPHLPEEVAHYEKHQRFVLTIKPGITGLAQINGRSDLDFEKEVELDSYYIEHWSMLLDLKILVRTIFVVLSGKGAD
ncbi:MAG: sugar transferase [Candidatus Gracilibacteria bacterium]